MNTKLINVYPKFKEVDGIRTSSLVYVNTLSGSEEELAKYVAQKAEEGYPVQYDETSGKPLVWFGKHTGVTGVASFNKDGFIYLKDDVELLLLEDDLKSEELSEMITLIAQDIRAIKRAWNAEIKPLMSKTSTVATIAPKVEESVAEEEDANL